MQVTAVGHGAVVTTVVSAKPPIRVFVSVSSVIVVWHGKVLDGRRAVCGAVKLSEPVLLMKQTICDNASVVVIIRATSSASVQALGFYIKIVILFYGKGGDDKKDENQQNA